MNAWSGDTSRYRNDIVRLMGLPVYRANRPVRVWPIVAKPRHRAPA